jgi:hypothetical protein
MFCTDMNPMITRARKIALLLAVLLPLQGFASVGQCLPARAAAAPTHCGHEGAAPGHHACGTCCLTAIAATLPNLAPARINSPARFSAPQCFPPTVILDRLERPPQAG